MEWRVGDEIIYGLSGIAALFRVSKNTVRAWYVKGAPIIRLGDRTYRAAFEEMLTWLKSQTQGEWENVRIKNH